MIEAPSTRDPFQLELHEAIKQYRSRNKDNSNDEIEPFKPFNSELNSRMSKFSSRYADKLEGQDKELDSVTNYSKNRNHDNYLDENRNWEEVENQNLKEKNEERFSDWNSAYRKDVHRRSNKKLDSDSFKVNALNDFKTGYKSLDHKNNENRDNHSIPLDEFNDYVKVQQNHLATAQSNSSMNENDNIALKDQLKEKKYLREIEKEKLDAKKKTLKNYDNSNENAIIDDFYNSTSKKRGKKNMDTDFDKELNELKKERMKLVRNQQEQLLKNGNDHIKEEDGKSVLDKFSKYMESQKSSILKSHINDSPRRQLLNDDKEPLKNSSIDKKVDDLFNSKKSLPSDDKHLYLKQSLDNSFSRSNSNFDNLNQLTLKSPKEKQKQNHLHEDLVDDIVKKSTKVTKEKVSKTINENKKRGKEATNFESIGRDPDIDESNSIELLDSSLSKYKGKLSKNRRKPQEDHLPIEHQTNLENSLNYKFDMSGRQELEHSRSHLDKKFVTDKAPSSKSKSISQRNNDLDEHFKNEKGNKSLIDEKRKRHEMIDKSPKKDTFHNSVKSNKKENYRDGEYDEKTGINELLKKAMDDDSSDDYEIIDPSKPNEHSPRKNTEKKGNLSSIEGYECRNHEDYDSNNSDEVNHQTPALRKDKKNNVEVCSNLEELHNRSIDRKNSLDDLFYTEDKKNKESKSSLNQEKLSSGDNTLENFERTQFSEGKNPKGNIRNDRVKSRKIATRENDFPDDSRKNNKKPIKIGRSNSFKTSTPLLQTESNVKQDTTPRIKKSLSFTKSYQESRLREEKSNSKKTPLRASSARKSSFSEKDFEKDKPRIKKSLSASTKGKSLSYTNISNIKPSAPQDIENQEELNSVKLREQIYFDWMQKKEALNKAAIKQKLATSKKFEEEKEASSKERKIIAQKTFDSWYQTKSERLKNQKLTFKEQKKKEKETEEEKQQRKKDAKKFFESWKQQKDTELKEKLKEKKGTIKEKNQKEEEEKKEKMMDNKKSFENWKSKKEEQLKDQLRKKREEEKRKKEEEAEKQERKEGAKKCFEHWKERKDSRPSSSRSTSPALTQRPWCPNSRYTSHVIPKEVEPVINRKCHSIRTFSANARLQTLR